MISLTFHLNLLPDDGAIVEDRASPMIVSVLALDALILVVIYLNYPFITISTLRYMVVHCTSMCHFTLALQQVKEKP